MHFLLGSLHFRLFSGKTNEFFSQKSKKPYFGAILGRVFSNLDNNKFSWKKELCQFLNILIIYHHAKSEKQLMSHFQEKSQIKGRTDRQTSRQTTMILYDSPLEEGTNILFVSICVLKISFEMQFQEHLGGKL